MKKKTKNIFVITAAIILVVIVIIGSTYAYWQITANQTNANTINTACFKTVFTEQNDGVSLNNTYPKTDGAGMKQVPYKFTLTNECDSIAQYQINLEVLNTSNLNSQYIKAVLNKKNLKKLTEYESVTKTLDNATESYKLFTGYLDQYESKSFELLVWMDEDTPLNNDTMSKSWNSKITIISSITDEIVKTFGEVVLSDNGGESAIAAKNNPDFTKAHVTEEIYNQIPDDTSNIVIDGKSYSGPKSLYTYNEDGMYAANDEYGASYYFRGNLIGNNVLFGGFQWKIVRINGNGSIRLIYNGTEAQFDNDGTVNENNANSLIGKSSFLFTYSTTKSSLNYRHSTVKTKVDQWYTANIANQEEKITSKIVDNIMCNDKTMASAPGLWNAQDSATTARATTYYGTYNRLFNEKTPSLKCSDVNDQFTLTTSKYGNKLLTNPISILSADEAIMAGSSLSATSNNYLNNNQSYWTSSPMNYHFLCSGCQDYAYIYRVTSSKISEGSSFYEEGNRPVINISENTFLISGDGSATNPYRVE